MFVPVWVFALCNNIDIDQPKEKCFKYVHDMQVQRIETFDNNNIFKLCSDQSSHH